MAHTHSLVAVNTVTGMLIFREVEGFGSENFDPAFEALPWLQGLCLAGGEVEALNDMLWHHANPQPEIDEDDYEPEYTLAGGYAAYDA